MHRDVDDIKTEICIGNEWKFMVEFYRCTCMSLNLGPSKWAEIKIWTLILGHIFS